MNTQNAARRRYYTLAPRRDKSRLVRGLQAAVGREAEYRHLLRRIAEIVPETAAEQRLRIAKNRERFEKNR